MLTDSARKRNRKEVLAKYNKIRINIGYQHDRCGIEGCVFYENKRDFLL
jgi:CRISPR/Cas system CSM-associated protein Csm2 small subunit